MFGSRLIGTAIWLTTGAKIKDPTSGMRLFSRKMIGEFAWNLNYGPEPDTVSFLIRRERRSQRCRSPLMTVQQEKAI